MSPQCSYFQNYSDLLTLLQCQRVTNVTIAVQVHINYKNLKKKKYIYIFFWRGNSASNYREIRVGRGNSAAAEKQRLYILYQLSSIMGRPLYEGFYNFSKVCCPTDFALNIST